MSADGPAAETPAPTAFAAFCVAGDAIRSTPSKTKKVETLASYLKTVSDHCLPFVCRLYAGDVFPPGSRNDLLVGYSALITVIIEISGASNESLSKTYRKHGDLGEAVSELLTEKRAEPILRNEITLDRLQTAFERMAAARGPGSTHERRLLLKSLFLDCTALEAKYLTKILAGELRIGLQAGLVLEAIGKAFGGSPREVRGAFLVLGDIGLTALSAKRGSLKDARIEPLHPTNFMLAEPMASAAEIASHFKGPVLAEYKYDGIRAQAHKADDRVRIFSRRLDDVSLSFPELVDSLTTVNGVLILDGEVLPYQDGRPLPFTLLQQRLRRKRLTPKLLAEIPVVYFVYDLLYRDGEAYLGAPLERRRALLESIDFHPPVLLSHMRKLTTGKEIETYFHESKDHGYEGLVVKDPISPYEPGRRGGYWVKLKKELDTLDVVIVGAEYGHGKRARVLSDYIFAVRSPGGLKVVGKAYSGLTDNEILGLTAKLKSITTQDLGYRRLVKPEIVLEVAFDNVQRSSRHDSGYALRFPRIKRIREDKLPADADTLARIEEIHRRQVLSTGIKV